MNWSKSKLITIYRKENNIPDHIKIEDDELFDWLYDEFFDNPENESYSGGCDIDGCEYTDNNGIEYDFCEDINLHNIGDTIK